MQLPKEYLPVPLEKVELEKRLETNMNVELAPDSSETGEYNTLLESLNTGTVTFDQPVTVEDEEDHEPGTGH